MLQDLEIRKRCAALLEKNSVKYGDVVYTRPSSGYYNFLWLWDSCFHTLIWSYFDINRALQELEAIFCGQAPGGMLPHMICFDKKKKLHRSPTVGEFKLWNDRGTSNLTQPPVLGFVLWRIYENTKNVKFIERFFDRTVDYYRALKKERDPDRDGLISIIHPWESGWDDSPRWDPVYGIKNPSKEDLAGRKLDLMNEYWATN
jgi:alpha,alpha-trehalase